MTTQMNGTPGTKNVATPLRDTSGGFRPTPMGLSPTLGVVAKPQPIVNAPLTESMLPTSQQQVKLLLMRYNALKNMGATEDKHAEFHEISRVLREMSRRQKAYVQRTEELRAVRVEQPKDEDLLRAQVHSYKLLSRNLDVPAHIQATLLDSISYNYPEERYAKKEAEGPEELDLTNFSKRAVGANLRQKTILPENSAVGSVAEAIVRNRLTQRLVELECLPANLGTFSHSSLEMIASDQIGENDDKLKLRALIELKSLRLLTKQKSLRQKIVYNLANKSDNRTQSMILRSAHRLTRIHTPQELRLTEELEKRQREARERREHEKRMQKINTVLKHSEEVYQSKRLRTVKFSNLGRMVMATHSQTEKEESKRAERTAKQRLQALRANDEDAYIRLLDQTKDTRITHLLKQTNNFLKSLSAAVKVQQQDAGVIMDTEETDENVDYYEVAHRMKEEVTKQPNMLVGGTLKEYQVKGLQWMVSLYNNNLNGILADEMGLGKTIQSISLITYLIEKKQQPGPYLVIVPLSTLTNWNLEFDKWAPTVKRVVYKGPPNARKAQQGIIRSGDFQVLLTTYEYIIKDRPLLSKIKWTHMIIDEGHRMKNTQSKLSSTLTQYYYSRHRLILTGTPLQNNLPELWALLNFVLPKIFNSVKTFDEWFNTPFANAGGSDRMELTEEETLLIIRRLHKVLRPFLLRRLKKDVEKDLPDKVEKVIKCQMSALQAKLYDQMLKHNVLFIGENEKSKNSVKGLNNKVMQLRKICNHPFVFEEVENMVNPSRSNTDDLWRVAGKFELLDRILPKFQATGHRVLMFFQMTQIMDIMEDYLRFRGMQYLRLDGATKADDRSNLLKLFNAENSPYFAFLLSTRAGGLGLNLQTADTVIIYDTDWNPHQDLQAQDRAHRIGQTKEVRILRLITQNSVEENILERAHAKLEIDGKVIQAGKFDNKSTSEEQEAFLRSLLEAEENKRSQKNDDEDMDDDELNDILARNDDEFELFRQFDAERRATDLYGKNKGKDRLLGYDELPEEYKQDITQHLQKETEDMILGRGARERKRVMYDDGLTEEQWLDAVDNDEDTIEAAIARKQARSARRAARKIEVLEGDDKERSEEPGAASDNEDTNNNVVEEEEEEETMKPAENGIEEELSLGKRKRTRRSTAGVVAEDGIEETPRPGKRNAGRKSQGPAPSIDDLDVEKVGNDIYEAVVEAQDETGRGRAELFLELPSKDLYPDYYQLIANPIALDMIDTKFKEGHYKSVLELRQDYDTMFSNAMTYNEQGSIVYEDAFELGKVVQNVIDSAQRQSQQAAQPTPKSESKKRKKLKLTVNGS
ncbi:transcription regulatory protein Snf2p [Trichomonascus vanleenenianus]|uniref:transcription regulatory protein Snf2p n=1 Tax=Trichomonascus vanleenenianus TaxID=2268995 RepID=UPI003ECA70A3